MKILSLRCIRASLKIASVKFSNLVFSVHFASCCRHTQRAILSFISTDYVKLLKFLLFLGRLWEKYFAPLNNAKFPDTFIRSLLSFKTWYIQAWSLKWFVIEFFFSYFPTVRVISNCFYKTKTIFIPFVPVSGN